MSASNKQAGKLASQCTEVMHQGDRWAQSMGMTPVSLAPGVAEVSMTIREDMLNGHGNCHGGAIFSLADTAFAHACNNQNVMNVALDCRIDFLRPAKAGDVLVAQARERHAGRTTGLYDIRIRNQHGKAVAQFLGRSYSLQQALIDRKE